MANKDLKKKIERLIKEEIRNLDITVGASKEDLKRIEEEQIAWYKVIEALEKV